MNLCLLLRFFFAPEWVIERFLRPDWIGFALFCGVPLVSSPVELPSSDMSEVALERFTKVLFVDDFVELCRRERLRFGLLPSELFELFERAEFGSFGSISETAERAMEERSR
tara:strand:+ start:458 stop:793 length:336 start_codon:yes stop_codon:yes gene_type:complete